MFSKTQLVVPFRPSLGFLRFRFFFVESQLFCEARILGTDKRISDSIVKWNRLEPNALYRIFPSGEFNFGGGNGWKNEPHPVTTSQSISRADGACSNADFSQRFFERRWRARLRDEFEFERAKSGGDRIEGVRESGDWLIQAAGSRRADERTNEGQNCVHCLERMTAVEDHMQPYFCILYLISLEKAVKSDLSKFRIGFSLDLTLRMNRALSKMAAITQTSRTGIWHLFTFLRYLDAWCWCQSSMSVWRRPIKCKFCCAPDCRSLLTADDTYRS